MKSSSNQVRDLLEEKRVLSAQVADLSTKLEAKATIEGELKASTNQIRELLEEKRVLTTSVSELSTKLEDMTRKFQEAETHRVALVTEQAENRKQVQLSVDVSSYCLDPGVRANNRVKGQRLWQSVT